MTPRSQSSAGELAVEPRRADPSARVGAEGIDCAAGLTGSERGCRGAGSVAGGWTAGGGSGARAAAGGAAARGEVPVTGRSRATGGGGAGLGRGFAGGAGAGGSLAVGLAGGFSVGFNSTARTRSAIWSGTTLSWFFASKTPPRRSLKSAVSSFDVSPTALASSKILTFPAKFTLERTALESHQLSARSPNRRSGSAR